MRKLSEPERLSRIRNLARTDLYFLLRYVLGRVDMDNQWLFDRCQDVHDHPDGMLDLWAREHYKSTIITFGKTIQDILASHGDQAPVKREVTVGIFSHSRPIAKGFLRQIKVEFERNTFLHKLFPDVFWQNPRRDAPKWSEDDGIVLRRKSNPKEATVEAWGLVDAQPTGKHFGLLVYDDVVTVSSVTTPDMIAKTTAAWEISQNLGSDGGAVRVIGTRYHFNDTYGEMVRRGSFTPRIFPATDNGEVDGKPVFLSEERLTEKRRDQGPYTFACQQLLNPIADAAQGFRRDWIMHYRTVKPETMNRYMLIDPASGKKKENDYTTLWVIGLGEDRNYYALDIVRDRLNLTERAELVIRKHQQWNPRMVGYERYGMQADIEHIKTAMEHENYRFPIQELAGTLGNLDRVRRLIPIFEQKRFYLPTTLYYTDYEKQVSDMVHVFIEEEFMPFPVGIHADMLDSCSRILDEDMNAHFPRTRQQGARSSTVQTNTAFDPYAA